MTDEPDDRLDPDEEEDDDVEPIEPTITIEIVAIGRPVVFGASRKSFLGKLTGRPERERVAATVAVNVIALERGASVFRVHDVPEAVDALKVAAATVASPWTTSPST